MKQPKLTITILIPALNEEKSLPATLANLKALDPQPDEILLVDGGSSDATIQLANDAGLRTMLAKRGRGPQINEGVEAATGDLVCVLHADSLLPVDAVAAIRATLSDKRIALASFTPLIKGPKKTRWITTFHNFIKTYYAPAIMKPHLFIRGVRLLFGDHAMFFHRADYIKTGGIPDDATVMEEADLCIRFAEIGKIKMIRKWVITSDRRIAEWGPLKANYIYLKIGIMWCFGARKRLGKHYPDVR